MVKQAQQVTSFCLVVLLLVGSFKL